MKKIMLSIMFLGMMLVVADNAMAQYTLTRNAAISGHNTRTMNGSVQACKRACNGFGWCKSFDYHKGKNKCDLSNKSKMEVALKRDYPGNPYDHYSRKIISKPVKSNSQRNKIIKGIGEKCLDVDQNGGTKVLMWQCHRGNNQLWAKRGDQIIGYKNRCLTANGGNVYMANCNGGQNQKWKYRQFTNGQQHIIGAENKCLDVKESRTNNGAPVILYQCLSNPNQKWSFMVGRNSATYTTSTYRLSAANISNYTGMPFSYVTSTYVESGSDNFGETR